MCVVEGEPQQQTRMSESRYDGTHIILALEKLRQQASHACLEICFHGDCEAHQAEERSSDKGDHPVSAWLMEPFTFRRVG